MKRTTILVSTFALVRFSIWYHYTSEHRVGDRSKNLWWKGTTYTCGLATAIHTLDAQQYRIDSTATGTKRFSGDKAVEPHGKVPMRGWTGTRKAGSTPRLRRGKGKNIPSLSSLYNICSLKAPSHQWGKRGRGMRVGGEWPRAFKDHTGYTKMEERRLKTSSCCRARVEKVVLPRWTEPWDGMVGSQDQPYQETNNRSDSSRVKKICKRN